MKYLFLFIFLPLFLFGQDQVETTVIPKPYNPKPYFDQINHTGIKKVITISKQKQNNFKDDTLSLYTYNEAGQEISSFRYDYNKITNKTMMKYDEHNNQVEWTILEPNGASTTTNFYYNPFNQLDSTRQISYRKNNIINTSRYAYQYEQGKLKSRQIIVNDIVNKADSYIYRDSLLSEFKTKSSADAYLLSKYSYDNRHQLTEVNTAHFFSGKTEHWNKRNFRYENEKLIYEEELTTDNKKLITHYSYNVNNKLQKITSSFGDFNMEVQFEYNDFDVKEITVNTNSNSAYLKFYIPLGLDNITYPIVYKEKFVYDEKHNLVSKQQFIGNDLIRETVYLVKYY